MRALNSTRAHTPALPRNLFAEIRRRIEARVVAPGIGDMRKLNRSASGWILGGLALGLAPAGCGLLLGLDQFSEAAATTSGSGTTGTGGNGGAGGMTSTGETTSGATTTTGGACIGGATSCTTEMDCPSPASDCVTHTCDNQGCCGTTNVASGMKCATDGGALCDGNGRCVACLATSDCAPTGTVCADVKCDAKNACVQTNAGKGKACTDQGGVTCDGLGACVAVHCNNSVKDVDETDLDCGGSCSPCANGLTCAKNNDCTNGYCKATVCATATCTDSAKNGDETDIDCGGSCSVKCPYLKGCASNSDCLGGLCQGTTCAATCSDGVLNGAETAIDCGGPT